MFALYKEEYYVFFFKKTTASEHPAQARWSVSTSQIDGHVMFVRKNESAQSLIGHSSYAHRVGFAVPLLMPNYEGLHEAEEAMGHGETEDCIADKLEFTAKEKKTRSVTN